MVLNDAIESAGTVRLRIERLEEQRRAAWKDLYWCGQAVLRRSERKKSAGG